MSSRASEATYFTICDERYFLGTVALLNSLRLTGNEGPLVVLDTGMTASQRSRLDGAAEIVTIEEDLKRPWILKAFPRFFDPNGVVIIIDSDMIVTRSLRYVIDHANAGRICAYPDHVSQWGRSFAEWERSLGLRAPLRRQMYLNSGFIALSTRRWPHFLERFAELLELVPVGSVFTGATDDAEPFWAADQDAFNAFLMSEIPEEEIQILPAEDEVHPDALKDVDVVDPSTLECRIDGLRPAILHYGMRPKAWDRRAWVRIRRDAYVRLFPRVVCGRDISVRVGPTELPIWLRPGIGGRTSVVVLDAAHRAASAVGRLSPRSADLVQRMKRRLLRGR
jgi:hypothetical protein